MKLAKLYYENNSPELLREENELSLSLNLTPNSEEYSLLDPDPTLLNIACANARSVVEKIKSLITLFEENCLHFAAITETWLSQKHCPPRVMADLTVGAELSFIRRDRGSRGGGVAVCYNPTKIRMSKFNFKRPVNDRTELVTAVGNCPLTKRKISMSAIYLPPSLNKADLNMCISTLVDCIDQVVTKYPDCIVFVAGDFNNKDLSTFTSAFPDIRPMGTGPTRRDACLDEIYTNVHSRIASLSVQLPLSKEDGTNSDHSVVAASFKLPRAISSVARTFEFRPISTEGADKFGALLAAFDWAKIQRSTSSESASALDDVLQQFIIECFPLKK